MVLLTSVWGSVDMHELWDLWKLWHACIMFSTAAVDGEKEKREMHKKEGSFPVLFK